MSEASIHFLDRGDGKLVIEFRIDGQLPAPGIRWEDLAPCQRAAWASFHCLAEKTQDAIERVERLDGSAELAA